MKEVTKERTNVEKYTVYVAVDGTEFTSEEECLTYESTAKGVLRGRFMKLAVCPPQDAWKLMGGCEDHDIVAVRVESEADKDVVKQTYYLDHSYLLGNSYETNRKAFEAKVAAAFCNNDLLLFGLNCDDILYVMDCRMNIVNRLLELDYTKEETKE